MEIDDTMYDINELQFTYIELYKSKIVGTPEFIY
jgi:hypothetical protein